MKKRINGKENHKTNRQTNKSKNNQKVLCVSKTEATRGYRCGTVNRAGTCDNGSP